MAKYMKPAPPVNTQQFSYSVPCPYKDKGHMFKDGNLNILAREDGWLEQERGHVCQTRAAIPRQPVRI